MLCARACFASNTNNDDSSKQPSNCTRTHESNDALHQAGLQTPLLRRQRLRRVERKARVDGAVCDRRRDGELGAEAPAACVARADGGACGRLCVNRGTLFVMRKGRLTHARPGTHVQKKTPGDAANQAGDSMFRKLIQNALSGAVASLSAAMLTVRVALNAR